MRRIVFYTGHKNKLKGIAEPAGNVSDPILYYTIFVCSLLIGCKLYAAMPDGSIISEYTRMLLANPIHKNCIIALICGISMVLLGIISAFSCTGAVNVIVIPLTEGLAFGVTAMYLLSHKAYAGLGQYVLTVVPFAVITVTASIAICSVAAELSKMFLMNALFGRNEKPDLKKRLTETGILCAVIPLGVIVLYATVKLFGGLF